MIPVTRLRLLLALLLCLAMISLVSAQGDILSGTSPEITEEPIISNDLPGPEVTDEPTAAPTETPPNATAEPPPGGEQPTPDESAGPEPPAEPEVPQEPTPSAPPVIEIAAAVSAQAGQPVDIPFALYDDQGATVITEIVSAAGAQTALAIAAPVQDGPPYITTGIITYTTDAAFSGTDTLSLMAVDGAGQSAAAAVQIEVQPAPLIEATEEATPEATPEPVEAAVPTVERVINYNPSASEDAIQAMLDALNATEISRIPQIGAMKVLVPDGMASASQAMAALHSNQAALAAGVSNVEANITYDLFFVPNDPAYNTGSNQWPLQDYAGSMYTEWAWDIAKQDGAGVLVAVLDTGVDLQHPDLAGQVDTSRGWDFINDDNDPDDDHTGGGHGTHVAGIIAAKTNNNLFMAGVAFRSKIIPVKVCTAGDGCPTYEIAAGIVHAVDRGAHIINLSLGGPTISTTVQGAVEYALSRNVTVIAAAGNSGTAYQYPASYAGVISVASHNINGVISGSSTQNDRVTISAPGVDVYSLGRLEQGNFFFWTGTSTATAHASGVAALIYADNVARTPAAIREALICSALDAGAAGYDNAFGHGMIQSDWALNWRENSANCRITQPNDLIQNATPVTKVPFSVTQPVHTRSVTTSTGDPTSTCAAPNQTLWYRFSPPANERYQITTYGSSYNTHIGVFQGVPGNMVQRACGSFSFDSGAFVSVDMIKGQTYYIMVSGSGTINDQLLQFDIRPAMSVANKDYDDSANNFAFSGGWQQIAVKGAAGGKVMQTWNDRGLATFTFRGQSFELYRMVGPDQGSMEVWINNTQFDFNSGVGGIQNLDNRAALQSVQMQLVQVPGALHGQWNTVTIRRVASGFAGSIAIDRIRPTDLNLQVITAKTDDRVLTKLNYSTGWTPQVSPGAFQNTVYRTTTNGASVQARVRGSTVLIFRNIGPGFGSMNVYVDGALWGTISNAASSSALGVPIAITNLTATEHVIRLQNNSGGTLEFDAIQGLTSATLTASSPTDIGIASILRSGPWAVFTTPGTVANKTYVSSTAGSRIDFTFNGDTLCVGFLKRVDGGVFEVYVDDMQTPYARVSTRPDNSWGSDYLVPPNTLNGPAQRYCSGAAFAEGVHHVRLVIPFADPVELDHVLPGRYRIITADSGLVQENDGRIVHTYWVYSPPTEDTTASWKRVSMTSAGGGKAQGGFVKRATFNPAPPLDPAIRFFMSGSGFIIYTTSGPDAGFMFIQICEPAAPTCSPANIILNGVSQGAVVELNTAGRARPFAYAVTGLGPGIHEILISVSGSASQYVDFDGVRVLP